MFSWICETFILLKIGGFFRLVIQFDLSTCFVISVPFTTSSFRIFQVDQLISLRGFVFILLNIFPIYFENEIGETIVQQ